MPKHVKSTRSYTSAAKKNWVDSRCRVADEEKLVDSRCRIADSALDVSDHVTDNMLIYICIYICINIYIHSCDQCRVTCYLSTFMSDTRVTDKLFGHDYSAPLASHMCILLRHRQNLGQKRRVTD